MDSLNFFFGLKAVSTPYVSDMPISETAIGNMSKHETTPKVASPRKELLKEEKITISNLQEQQSIDLGGSDRAILGSLVEKCF